MMKYYFLFFALLSAACGSLSQSATAPKASEIKCTVAYRSSVTQPIEQEEMITFADADLEQQIVFDDAVFNAAYTSGDFNGERSLRLWITESAESVEVSQSQLFQLELNSGPKNQFLGGHGFTGLHYSYHPVSGSETQYWCEAVE
ncbi:MAG: hypothetical protein AAGD96_05375 [Chloroflexota bacterium]